MTDSAAALTILEQVQARLAAISLENVTMPGFHKCSHFEALSVMPSEALKRLFAAKWSLEERLRASTMQYRGMNPRNTTEDALKAFAINHNAEVNTFRVIEALLDAQLSAELSHIAVDKSQEFLGMVVVEPDWTLGWLNHSEEVVMGAIVEMLTGGRMRHRRGSH